MYASLITITVAEVFSLPNHAIIVSSPTLNFKDSTNPVGI
jgi:hypothetical protein